MLLAGVSSLALLAGGVMRDAHASAGTPLLPDLVADPPDNMSLATSSVEGRSRLLLRFNGYIHNSGPGALDIRGTRAQPTAAGKTSQELSEEVAYYKAREESLPQGLEEELRVPAMSLAQREFTTNEGSPWAGEEYLERPHVDVPAGGEMLYASADGHHHWHLQHVVRYSLWNAAKTAEVAPAQKVGFCLEDSQHVDATVGPGSPVYADSVPPYARFCRRFEPNTTNVYEGVSPGWRDVYGRELAMQWVDVSDVLPGEYWLREDVDPTRIIEQAEGGPKAEYSRVAAVIPGFDAVGGTVTIGEGEAVTVNLLARGYEEHTTPLYTIVARPAHGTLGELTGSRVTYTPDAGYSGNDSFTYSVRDASSQFPEHPMVAAVSIAVNSKRASIAISGAQAQMVSGTSVQLSAIVANDPGAVEWEASSGTVTAEGAGGRSIRYTAPPAPPAGGSVTLTARLQDQPAVLDARTIAIRPVPPAEPAPEPFSEPPPTAGEQAGSPAAPSSPSAPSGAGTGGSTTATVPGSSGGAASGVAGYEAKRAVASVTRPRALIFGRVLVVSTVPSAAGYVRLTAYWRGRTLGSCATETPGGRAFTCRMRLGRKISLRARISVRATLRAGGLLLQSLLPAARIPEMQERPSAAGGSARTASPARAALWSNPSTFAGLLGDG